MGRQTEVGVPPFMDDLVIPLSDESPVALLSRITAATNILDATATAFGFEVQHGPVASKCVQT